MVIAALTVVERCQTALRPQTSGSGPTCVFQDPCPTESQADAASSTAVDILIRVGLNVWMHLILRVSGVGETILGVLLMFGSRSALEVVTAVTWELELLRYLGLFLVPLGLLLAWDRRRGSPPSHSALRHIAGAWTVLFIYVFTKTGLLLILGFSVLAAATVELGLARAWVYSEDLRRRLDTGGRPQG